VIVRAPSDDGQNVDLWYLNYTTGETVWHITVGSDVPSAESTLLTGDRRIFTGCGLTDQVGYRYSGICAYRKLDGKLSWQFSNPCNCTPEAHDVSSLNWNRHLVLFGYFNGGSEGKEYVLAARATSGKILGAYQTGGQGSQGSTPIAHGFPQLYFDCGGNLCALHRLGSFAWMANIGSSIGGITADSNHRVYATVCNGPAGLMAFDDAAGAPLWSFGTSQCNQSPAAVTADRVFFTSADGAIHALDGSTGAEIWSVNAGAASSPSLANGLLYVAGSDGTPAARAYDAGTGALVWSMEPHSSSHHLPPMVIDGMLFVANGACGSVCAFKVPSPSGKHGPFAAPPMLRKASKATP
jgi:outer membrane protein assembly factor BamB